MRAVVGIGNLERGDDGAGWRVADLVSERRLESVVVMKCRGDVTELLECFREYEEVILIDAVQGLGDIRSWDGLRGPVPCGLSASNSHVLGVPQAIELARALGQLPKRLVVIGVPGTIFAAGAEMSEVTMGLIPQAAEWVAREMSEGVS